jgi:hypothetical protein
MQKIWYKDFVAEYTQSTLFFMLGQYGNQIYTGGFSCNEDTVPAS